MMDGHRVPFWMKLWKQRQYNIEVAWIATTSEPDPYIDTVVHERVIKCR